MNAGEVDPGSADTLLDPVYQETLGGGPQRNRAEVPQSITEQMQRGIQEYLWPKFFPKCPVARHFV
jgi:hypothetical protein